MPYILVESFNAGLDKRRSVMAAPPGTLQTLRNAVITRGGEIEKAKAFVNKIVLPTGVTFGLMSLNGELWTFGSSSGLTIPTGIRYQQLPSAAGNPMTGLVSCTIFAGKFYAVARFANGKVVPYYNGVPVADFYVGQTRADHVTLAGVATEIAGNFAGDTNYTATSSGPVITITGPAATPFDVAVSAVNGGTVNDQTITTAVAQAATATSIETASKGLIQITGGTALPGVNKVTSIQVGGTELLKANVDWVTSHTATAAALVTAINDASATNGGYRATSSTDTVTIYSPAGQSVANNGRAVTVFVNGNITAACTTMAGGIAPASTVEVKATGLVQVTGGTAGAGVNKVTSIQVASIEILGASIDWATSNIATAAALATQINVMTPITGYTAATGGTAIVTISSPTGQAVANNGRIVSAVAGGTVTLALTNMSGGVAPTGAVQQQTTVTLGGTVDPGDIFTITINRGKTTEKTFSGGRVCGLQPSFCMTHNNRVLLVSGSLLIGSAIANANGYQGEDIGAFVIDLSSRLSGTENLTGLADYQNFVAIMAQRTTQIWNIDDDPSLNSPIQKLKNFGTSAGKSIAEFGETDVFFLNSSGVRSLRARYATNTASTADVGSAIDDIVTDALITLTAAQVNAAASVVEPITGRFWLALSDQVYIFSSFPSSKIEAWAILDNGLTFIDFAVIDRKLWARAGDTVYLYGGDNGKVWSAAAQPEVELPFLDGRSVATFKQWTSFDVVCDGKWDIYAATDPNQPDEEELIGKITGTTVGDQDAGFVGDSPVVKLRFVCTDTGYARLSKIIVHYAEHE